ncbi:Alpha/Beta hydrolase protein [Russula emetica]|nr:Alpha/Beta hydrolase protein [Russula emetica]
MAIPTSSSFIVRPIMMMFLVILPFFIIQVWSQTVTVNTTSGRLLGTQADGVASFKGIRFAHPPVGDLRWEPPVAFVSSDIQNATSVGPSCVQQFSVQGQAFVEDLYNTPVPAENEDCLYLNVWAPASSTSISGPLKPVIVWFYGGVFEFGTASLPIYDGTSFAKNQDVILVSFNYRTNVFGFPTSQEISAPNNNLGLLDQELALAWVQDNIAQFGGDKNMVTIMGQSAGSWSVSLAITRRKPDVPPPFRAGIMLSGAKVSNSPVLNFSIFDAFATAMGCAQTPGPQRLQCLRNVPASTIRAYTNGPNSGLFTSAVDNVTFLDDPLQRIRTGQIARVPILLGNMENDGTAQTYNTSLSISEFLTGRFGSVAGSIPPDNVRALYPGLSDPQVIASIERDMVFRCPAKLWSDAFVSSGIRNVYRYTYGATFANLQPFPNLGAWHGSELSILFGTFNRSTATSAEVELSQSLQTAFANFAKNPNSSPAPHWPAYEPEETWALEILSNLFNLIPRMDRAVYGTLFWISAPEKLATSA